MIAIMPFICGILLIGNSIYQWFTTGMDTSGPCLSGVFLLIVGIILHWYFSNEKALKKLYSDHYLNDLHQ